MLNIHCSKDLNDNPHFTLSSSITWEVPRAYLLTYLPIPWHWIFFVKLTVITMFTKAHN